MTRSALSHSAYVFDAYGTLFDVHAAVRKFAGEIGPDGPGQWVEARDADEGALSRW